MSKSCFRWPALLITAVHFMNDVSPTAAATIAYYPFDSQTSGVTPDASGNSKDLTLGSVSGATASIAAGGMFSNALTTTAVNQFAQRADGDTAFDTVFPTLSVGLWLKSADFAISGNSGRQRFLTGKFNTGGGNRGWSMQILDATTPVAGGVTQLEFGGPPTASDNVQYVRTPVASLNDGLFHHLVGTFNGATGSLRVYIDGKLANSLTTSPTLNQLTGENASNFQVANRGTTAGNASSGGGVIGAIDDYLISTDLLSDQQVALVHGLGRLANVTLADSADIAAVLNAYNTQTAATAGGVTWNFMSNVGGGNTIGQIGGSVGSSDAFIVLGNDGSGVTLVPEPQSFVLMFIALSAAGWKTAKRRPQRR